MNSRERIQAALAHCQPDATPIDFNGHRSSGIMALAYRKLRRELGLPARPVRVYDMIQQLAVIDDDVLDTGVVLAQHRLNGALEKRPLVERHRHDGELGSAHVSQGQSLFSQDRILQFAASGRSRFAALPWRSS